MGKRGRIVRTIALALGLAVVSVGGITAKDTLITDIAHVGVTSDKIAEGRPLRILQITDLHDLSRGYQRRSIIRAAERERPDLIVITGDIVHTNTTDWTRMRELVEGLVATGVPVYFSYGNHDHWDLNFDGAFLRAAGVRVLVDEHVSADGPWGRVDLAATDDYYSGHGDLAKALAGGRPGAFTLVLSHSAEGVIPQLGRYHPDLVLSGHTHGGQVRVPVLSARVLPVATDEGRRYVRGVFYIEQTTVYIDQGVGTTGVPLRFLAPSQVTLLEVSHS